MSLHSKKLKRRAAYEKRRAAELYQQRVEGMFALALKTGHALVAPDAVDSEIVKLLREAGVEIQVESRMPSKHVAAIDLGRMPTFSELFGTYRPIPMPEPEDLERMLGLDRLRWPRLL